MSCHKRCEINDKEAERSEDGGVVTVSEDKPAINDNANRENLINVQTLEVKPREKDLIAAEISTVDAISAGVKLPINGVDDLSDTTSVSDDTPPSTPNSRVSTGQRRSRRRKLSLNDSQVSSSSSPARGILCVC